MKKCKRVLSILLAVVFILSLCMVPAFATTYVVPLPGKCDHIYWVTLEEEIVCIDENQHYVTITNYYVCSECGHEYRELSDTYYRNHSLIYEEEIGRDHISYDLDYVIYRVSCQNCTYVGTRYEHGACTH